MNEESGQDEWKEAEIKNGLAAALAETTNKRLKITVLELRKLQQGISDLNASIFRFNRSSDKYSRRLIFLTWGLIVFTIILVGMTLFLIIDGREAVSAQDNIALNAEFFNDTNTGIIADLENNQPILVENKGRYTDVQLDNYLGDFDTITDAYNEGLLSEMNLCDSFSYYIGITASSSEVQKYMTTEGLDYYSGLPDLTKVVNASKNPNCH